MLMIINQNKAMLISARANSTGLLFIKIKRMQRRRKLI